MIYIETITDNLDTFRIERQKDTPDGNWYGICLYQSVPFKELADNDVFIRNLPITLIYDSDSKMEDMGIKNTEQNDKLIRKLVKKADKLGWFDHLE